MHWCCSLTVEKCIGARLARPDPALRYRCDHQRRKKTTARTPRLDCVGSERYHGHRVAKYWKGRVSPTYTRGRIIARDLLRAQQPVASRAGVEVRRRGRRRATGPFPSVKPSARQRDAVDRHSVLASQIVDDALEVGEADVSVLCRRRPVDRAVPLVARVVRAGGPGNVAPAGTAAPDCKDAARRSILHELVDELAEANSDHGFCVFHSPELDGHCAVGAFLLPAPEGLNGAAAAGLLREHAHDHSRRRRGLLRDAHDHSVLLRFLHRDHPHLAARLP
mmetsp:Transcript_7456/g.19505  ORF Transcript_7456/g.19505 Transcript_7456/m.19505 type:complete len:278 (-) Transcript_7456:59-892(-)